MQQSYETLPDDSLRQFYSQVCRGSADRGILRASCAWPPRDTWHWIFCWTSSRSSDIATALRQSWPSETQCFLKTVNTNQKSVKYGLFVRSGNMIPESNPIFQDHWTQRAIVTRGSNMLCLDMIPDICPAGLVSTLHTLPLTTNTQQIVINIGWKKKRSLRWGELTFIVHSLVNSCGSLSCDCLMQSCSLDALSRLYRCIQMSRGVLPQCGFWQLFDQIGIRTADIATDPLRGLSAIYQHQLQKLYSSIFIQYLWAVDMWLFRATLFLTFFEQISHL